MSFREGRAGTQEVMERVGQLLGDLPPLLVAFDAFLPEGHRFASGCSPEAPGAHRPSHVDGRSVAPFVGYGRAYSAPSIEVAHSFPDASEPSLSYHGSCQRLVAPAVVEALD